MTGRQSRRKGRVFRFVSRFERRLENLKNRVAEQAQQLVTQPDFEQRRLMIARQVVDGIVPVQYAGEQARLPLTQLIALAREATGNERNRYLEEIAQRYSDAAVRFATGTLRFEGTTREDVGRQLDDVSIQIGQFFEEIHEPQLRQQLEQRYILIATQNARLWQGAQGDVLRAELRGAAMTQTIATMIVYPLIGTAIGGGVGGLFEGIVHAATGHGLDMRDVVTHVENSFGNFINRYELLAHPGQWVSTAQQVDAALVLAGEHRLGYYPDLQIQQGMTSTQQMAVGQYNIDHVATNGNHTADIHTMSATELAYVQSVATAPAGSGYSDAQIEAAKAIVGAVNAHHISVDPTLVPVDAGKTYGLMQSADVQTTSTQTVSLAQYGYDGRSLTIAADQQIKLVNGNLEIVNNDGTIAAQHITFGADGMHYYDAQGNPVQTPIPAGNTTVDVNVKSSDYVSATSVNGTMYVSPDAGTTYLSLYDHVDANGDLVITAGGHAAGATGIAIDVGNGKFEYVQFNAQGEAIIPKGGSLWQYLNTKIPGGFTDASEVNHVFDLVNHPIYLVADHGVNAQDVHQFEDLAAMHGNGTQVGSITEHTTNYNFEAPGTVTQGSTSGSEVTFAGASAGYHVDAAGDLYAPDGYEVGTHFNVITVAGMHEATWVDSSGVTHYVALQGSNETFNVDPANIDAKFPGERFDTFAPSGYQFFEDANGHIFLMHGTTVVGDVVSIDNAHHMIMTVHAPDGTVVGTANFDLTTTNPDLINIHLLSTDVNHPITINGHEFYFKDGSYMTYNENTGAFTVYNSQNEIIATNLQIKGNQLTYYIPSVLNPNNNPLAPVTLGKGEMALNANSFHTLASRATPQGVFDTIGTNVRLASIPVDIAFISGITAAVAKMRSKPETMRATRNVAFGSLATTAATLAFGPFGLIAGALGTFEFAIPAVRKNNTTPVRIGRGLIGAGSAILMGVIASTPIGWVAAAATGLFFVARELRGTGVGGGLGGRILNAGDDLFDNPGNFVQNHVVRNAIAAGVGTAVGVVAGLATGGLAWAPVIIGAFGGVVLRDGIATIRGGIRLPNLSGIGTGLQGFGSGVKPWFQDRGYWISHRWGDYTYQYRSGHGISTGLFTGAAGAAGISFITIFTGGLAIPVVIIGGLLGAAGGITRWRNH